MSIKRRLRQLEQRQGASDEVVIGISRDGQVSVHEEQMSEEEFLRRWPEGRLVQILRAGERPST